MAEVSSATRARDENFPVGSRLIHPRLRPVVMDYYAFARAADDVADDPALEPAEKLERLDRFETALTRGAGGPEVAARLRRSLAQVGVGDRHARDLLVAFRRDAAGQHCADWAALADYCAHSAHPVGRFLLELHGERAELWPMSDALCASLQILNHLQDLREDYARRDRVYLPRSWMEAEGVGPAALRGAVCSPGLRRVIDRALDSCDALIDRAWPLPPRLASRRLAGETETVLRLARRLSRRLRTGDPLARRIALSSLDFATAGLGGLAFAARPRRMPGAAGREAPG